jgi:hypothetical protein
MSLLVMENFVSLEERMDDLSERKDVETIQYLKNTKIASWDTYCRKISSRQNFAMNTV